MEIISCNKSEYVWYQVQKYDNLTSILKLFETSSNKVIRNNPNIDLYEGEMIKILQPTSSLHIVKPMETLDTIARKYNVIVDDLIIQNNLVSKRLFIGQTLVIDMKNK